MIASVKLGKLLSFAGVAALLCTIKIESRASNSKNNGGGVRASSRHLQSSCPPANYETKSNFDATTYVENGPWYPLAQLPVLYQRPNSLFCVRATYTIEPDRTLWCRIFRRCDKTRIDVLNQARTGGVDAEPSDANLHAFIEDDAVPSQLSVAPRFLPPLFYGPNYFVMEAGTYTELIDDNKGKGEFTSTDYQWAIISGGPADEESNGACITGEGFFNGEGFWLFSNTPSPPEGALQKLEELAASFGVDTSVLLPVVQDGCWDQ